ncbi:MAG: MFS transporter [Candidatus Latescibacterota bacterium]
MASREMVACFGYWRKRVFFTLWVTYASFYLCRVNMAVALPGIMDAFGFSKTDVGMIGSTFFILYAIGQFVSGQLGDKWGARRMIPVGIFASAALNAWFAFSSSLTAMCVIWGFNGIFQSVGWAPSVKTLANWFPTRVRGKISGLYGSCFQIGNVVSWLLAGYLASRWGWQAVFWVPSIAFALFGVHAWVRIRNAPEDVGLPPIEEYEQFGGFAPHNDSSEERARIREKGDQHAGFAFTMRCTLGNPKAWCAGLAYLFLSVVGYGFMFWAPTYLSEVHGVSISRAAIKAMVIPLSGVVAAFLAGWMTDRFFGSRRAPVVVGLMIFAGVFLWFFPFIPVSRSVVNLCALGLIGGAAISAQTLIVTGMAMDIGTRKAASSVTGFIDALGYVGATLTGVGTGWLIEHTNWTVCFHAWAGSVWVGAGLMALLWRYRPSGEAA